MGMESQYLKIALRGLTENMKNAEEVERIIITHSLAASAAAVASGWVPGAGGAIATGIGFGFVVAMYIRICSEFNIKIKKNVLKSLASVVVAETAAYLAVIIAAEIAITFIPGIGNLGGPLIGGIVNFGIVYVAGILFLLMMTRVFKAGGNINTMSEEEIIDAMKAVSTKENIDKAYKESKTAHKEAKKDDSYNTEDIKPYED